MKLLALAPLMLAIVLCSGCDYVLHLSHVDPPDAALACPTDAILCDDFESGGVAKWTGQTESHATVVVDNAAAHSGMYGLDITGMASAGAEGDVYLTIAPMTTGVLAVRAWINVSQPLTAFDSVMTLGPDFGTHLEVSSDVNLWRVIDGAADYDSDVTTPALGTWTCVEVDYDYDTPSVAVFVGSATAISSTVSAPGPAFARVAVGLTFGQAAGAALFVDDVVIATSHIGC